MMLVLPDPPKWVEETLGESKEYFGNMTKAVTHPVETLEAIAQNVNDTYEVEGLEYMGGYIVGDIIVGEISAAAVSKAVGKGAGAVDDIGNIANKADDVADVAETAGKMDDIAEKSGGYTGDLMSVEDAARYSEYWRELGIGSDKTWNEFIKANPNKSIDDYIKIIKEQSPWQMVIILTITLSY